MMCINKDGRVRLLRLLSILRFLGSTICFVIQFEWASGQLTLCLSLLEFVSFIRPFLCFVQDILICVIIPSKFAS